MNKIFNFFTGFFLLLFMFSCGKSAYNTVADNARVFHTWNSLKEMNYGEPVPPPTNFIPEQGFSPWAGIVSHHILAHEYIDAWFSCLSKMRNPKRFFILSPDHFDLSVKQYSLTEGSWDSGFGIVESDKNKVKELSELLEVDPDNRVFEIEHGISVLMPYIKRYFPDSRIVAIIVNGGSAVNTLIAGRLADVLEKEFDEEGKKDNFLIISSDFSHKGNPEETEKNDLKSEQYLINIENSAWNSVICDNRSGIYILNRLRKKNAESRILYHTNSYKISGYNEDITSYFFVFFQTK